MALRFKHVEQPDKFLDSEVDLDEHIKSLMQVSGDDGLFLPSHEKPKTEGVSGACMDLKPCKMLMLKDRRERIKRGGHLERGVDRGLAGGDVALGRGRKGLSPNLRSALVLPCISWGCQPPRSLVLA